MNAEYGYPLLTILRGLSYGMRSAAPAVRYIDIDDVAPGIPASGRAPLPAEVITDAEARAERLRHASQHGKLFGQEWGHNPWELAAAMNITVHVLPAAEFRAAMLRPDTPGRRTVAFSWLGIVNADEREVWIDGSQSPEERAFSLAHEVAHFCYQTPNEVEAIFDTWASAFLGVSDG